VVRLLNTLQVLNAIECLYFDSRYTSQDDAARFFGMSEEDLEAIGLD